MLNNEDRGVSCLSDRSDPSSNLAMGISNNNYRAFIKKGSEHSNDEQFLRALRLGDAIVLDHNDSILNYNEAVQVNRIEKLSSRITEVKINVIEKYKRSPRRKLRDQNK